VSPADSPGNNRAGAAGAGVFDLYSHHAVIGQRQHSGVRALQM
jgi:hypothetical protein